MASLPVLCRVHGTGGAENLIPLLLAHPIFSCQVMLPYSRPNTQNMRFSPLKEQWQTQRQSRFFSRAHIRRLHGRTARRPFECKDRWQALHMQLADRVKLPSTVYFGFCLAMRVLTNMQDLTDFHWLDLGGDLYILMLHASSMSSLFSLKSNCIL